MMVGNQRSCGFTLILLCMCVKVHTSGLKTVSFSVAEEATCGWQRR